MRLNVFGSTSESSEKKIYTSLFVQKPYLRTDYIESDIEENTDLKSQFRTEKIPHPDSIHHAGSKNYVVNLSIVRIKKKHR